MKSKLESIQASTSSMDTALASGNEESQARAMVSHSWDCSLLSVSDTFCSASSSDAATARVCSAGLDILRPANKKKKKDFFGAKIALIFLSRRCR